MTLDTRIYVHDPVDYWQVWVRCNQLIGADEGTRFTDEPEPHWKDGERTRGPEGGDWSIWNEPGQGLCALLDISYRKNAPLRAEPEPCDQYCEHDDDWQHAPACWLEISFDTAYSYTGPEGGCGDLHARLVAELGRWLDEAGVRWSWQNEFTGEYHQGYEGLAELGAGGLKALDWFATQALPAIERLTEGEGP